MTSSPGDPAGPAATAAAIVAAINERDRDGLLRLLGPGAEILTGRKAHAGAEAILAWARKEYDHLARVYAIDEYRAEGGRVLALGSVHYVWIEGGEVADSSPIALLIEIVDGALRRLTVHDDARAALADFESGAAS